MRRARQLLFLGLAGVFPSTLASAHEISLDRRELLLGDIAVLEPAQRARIGELVVLRAPEGRNLILLSAERVSQLIRRRVPGADFPPISDETLILRFAPDETRQKNVCLQLAEPVAAGGYLYRELAEEVACRANTPSPPLLFDRQAMAPHTANALPKSTYLGPLSLASGTVFSQYDKLHLRFASGPVVVEREGQPIAPARNGQKAVIRFSDGSLATAILDEPVEGNQ